MAQENINQPTHCNQSHTTFEQGIANQTFQKTGFRRQRWRFHGFLARRHTGGWRRHGTGRSGRSSQLLSRRCSACCRGSAHRGTGTFSHLRSCQNCSGGCNSTAGHARRCNDHGYTCSRLHLARLLSTGRRFCADVLQIAQIFVEFFGSVGVVPLLHGLGHALLRRFAVLDVRLGNGQGIGGCGRRSARIFHPALNLAAALLRARRCLRHG